MDELEEIKDLFAKSRNSSRPVSPVLSCLSMKSDNSIDRPPYLEDGRMPPENSKCQGSMSLIHSSVSMKSNLSIEQPPNISGGMPPEEKSDTVTSMGSIRSSWSSYTADTEKKGKIGTQQGCAFLEKTKSNMKSKFQCLHEGTANQGNPILLNDIYTKVYITEDRGGEINNDHEVRQIEAAFSRASTEDKPINCNDIFKPLPEQDKPIRTVLTKGVAGIGKTVSVQKFILDWAEGKANQDVHLIFPLPFRELNFMKDQNLSLLDLFNIFNMETKEMDKYKVYIILDGLDECRLSLDFHSSMRLCDVNQSASVDVLLTNLIKGNLLPSALLWITSRPAAADLIPSECVDRVTEVRGFNDPQKEEYFRKKVSDESLANRIISHLKSSRSLYIMCHIPVFCWISATVLDRMLSEAESAEIPKTLTQMYTHFLIIQTNIKHKKDYEKKVKDEEMILKLGKLAFEQLEKTHLIFYEKDLRECGIDVKEASVYSGVFTQIFREDVGVFQSNMYCFVHQSIQEYLAALYVHLSFIMDSINMLSNTTEFMVKNVLRVFNSASTRKSSMTEMHQSAVKRALKSENGHLDLFLRFLLGLSLESNQMLLQDRLTHTGITPYNKETIVAYIKKKIVKNPSPERSINLFHCLNELNDLSLVKEIQHYLKSGALRKNNLLPSQWSALTFFILISEEELDVFDFGKYAEEHRFTDDVLLRLLPVIEASRVAELYKCKLTDKCCGALASTLSSKSSCLRELDLGRTNLQDSGLKLLCVGLKSSYCKLERLSLHDCNLTEKCCEDLASILSVETSSLKVLDLSENRLKDSGIKLLCSGLKSPNCEVKDLSLWNCGITDEGCDALASALRSNPSHLRDFSLSGNTIRDSGVKMLSKVLENPECKLEMLWLKTCAITDEGCAALALALRSNPSHLRELSLYGNDIGDSGVKLLTALKNNDEYKLEIIEYGLAPES